MSTKKLLLSNCGAREGFWESLELQGDQPVNPKGIFIGRTGAETEAPVIWPSDVKSWLIGKDTDTRKDWGQEEEVTENEVVGWHHQFNGHEFEQVSGHSEGQGRLVCPWCIHGVTKSQTQHSNWTMKNNLFSGYPCICSQVVVRIKQTHKSSNT